MVTKVSTTVIKPNVVLPGTGAITLAKGTSVQEPSPINGMIRYDETLDKLRAVEGGVWVNVIGGVGGGSKMNSLLSADGANTINNGDNQQIWNWNLTSNNKKGLVIGEDVASTGTGTRLFEISTLAGSTADPFTVLMGGQSVFHISNGGAIFAVPPAGSGAGVNLSGGEGSNAVQGGSVMISGGYAGNTTPSLRFGGNVSIEGGSGQNADNIGDGGYVEIRGGGADPTEGNGGYVWIYGGNVDTQGNGGNVRIDAGVGAGTGTPGEVLIFGGTSSLGGGLISLTGGNATGSGTNGGNVNIASGNNVDINSFSQVELRSGTISTGTMLPSVITIESPTDDGVTKKGGSINLQAGAGDDGATSEAADGGNIQIAAGVGGLTSGAGGDLLLNAGSASGGNSNGGSIYIDAGDPNGSGTSGSIQLTANNTVVQLSGTGSLVHFHSAQLTTGATDGFIYIRGCAGVPSGTPSTITYSHPMVWDGSNDDLYVYSNGSWKLVGGGGDVTLTGNQILTNKTLTNPNSTDQTLTDAATINWDMNSGAIAQVTLGGNRAMAAPTNLKKGTYILYVIQDATGSRTLSWNAAFKWAGGTAPTLSTAAGAKDILTFVCDGTNLYGAIQKAFA